MKRQIGQCILGLIVLLSLVACGGAAQPVAQSSDAPVASASANPSPPSTGKPKIGATGTILTIRANGGMCPNGGCWSEKQINADGAYRATDGTGAQKEGTLDPARVAELTQLIAATNFAEIRARPFTGTCPIAFDGQELVYTFQTLSGPETIASCTVAIDENSPLFKNITGLLDAMNQQ